MKQLSSRMCAIVKNLFLWTSVILVSLFSFATSGAQAQAASENTLYRDRLLSGEAPAVVSSAAPDYSASAATVKVYTSDAQLYHLAPATNFADEAYLGDPACPDLYNCEGDIQSGSVLKPLLDSLPPNITITSAIFHLRMIGYYDYPGSIHRMSLYRVITPWHAGLVTWNGRPATAELVGTINAGMAMGTWYTVNITSLVNGWYQGSIPNYGLMMKGPSESDLTYRVFSAYDFGRDEKGEDSRPYVEITYTPASPALSIPAQNPAFLTDGTGGVQRQVVTLQNTGSLPLDWSITGLPSWLALSQSSGTLGPAISQQIALTSSVTGQTYGSHAASLNVTSSTPGVTPRSLPVTLYYKAPPIPVYSLPTIFKGGTPSLMAGPNLVVFSVGIADYRYMPAAQTLARAGIPGQDLVYTRNDIVTMQETIHALNGKPAGSAQFIALEDSQATKEAIQQKFQEIARTFQQTGQSGMSGTLAANDTTFVFFYSGHGGSAPDHNGDEVDDEFIATYLTDILYDAYGNPVDYSNIITDDELDAWLNQIPAAKIVVMLDSCYSGGMITSQAMQGKGAQWQERGLPFPGTPAGQDVFDGPAMSDLEKPGRIILTASQDHQTSIEVPQLQQGVFSYYLTMALSDPTADANRNGWVSAVEAFNYLSPKVKSYAGQFGITQIPVLSNLGFVDADLTKP